MEFNPKEHEHTAKAIIEAAKKGGLNEKHPAVQQAMVALHQKILGLMPNSSDEERGRELSKRGPILAENIKRMLPVQHLGVGDYVKDALSGIGGAVLGNTKPIQGELANIAGTQVDTTPTGQPAVGTTPPETPSAATINEASQNMPDARPGHGASGSWEEPESEKDNESGAAKFNRILGGDTEGLSQKDIEERYNQPVPKTPIVTQQPVRPGESLPIPPAAPAAPTDGTSTPPSSPDLRTENPLGIPNAGSNAQELMNNATTPITGTTAALQSNQNRAQNYAATQTPEAMAAAQKDKGAVLSGIVAGSGQSPGTNAAALTELANLGQNNLQAQQNYGNASLQEANKTNLDIGTTQGQNIQNATNAVAAPRAGAINVLQQKLKVASDNNDFDQITKSLAVAKSLPSDVSQAIWANDTTEHILHILALSSEGKGATPGQKSAITNLITSLQKHTELRPADGVIDEGSIKAQIQVAKQKNVNALDIAQKEANIQTGGPLSGQGGTEPGYATGGIVTPNEQPEEDMDEPDLSDTEDTDLSPQDVLRRALGLQLKTPVAKNELNAEDTAGPTTAKVAEKDVIAEKEPNSGAVLEPIPGGAKEQVQSMSGEGPSTGNTDIGSLLSSSATARGIDPRDAQAIAKTESSMNPNAINSNKNGTQDYGLMQVNSSNLKPGEEGQAFDPEFNIGRGLDIYKQGLDAFGGNKAMAAYAYNHGINRAQKVGPAVAAQDPYVKRFMSNLPQQ